MLQANINRIKALEANQILIGNTVYQAKVCIMDKNHNAIQAACCGLLSLIYNKQSEVRGDTKYHNLEIDIITKDECDAMVAEQQKNPDDIYPIMIDCGNGFLDTKYVSPPTKRAYSKDKNSITNVPFSALGTLWRNTYKTFDLSRQFMYVVDYNFIIPIERYFYMHIPDSIASTIGASFAITQEGFNKAVTICTKLLQAQIDAALAIQEYYTTIIANKLSIFSKIKKVKTENVPPLILNNYELPWSLDLIHFCIPYNWNMDTPCKPGQYMFNGLLYEQDDGTWRWEKIYYLPDHSAKFCNSQYTYRTGLSFLDTDKKIKNMGVLKIGGSISDVDWIIFDTKDHAIRFIDYLNTWRQLLRSTGVE